MYVQNVEKNGGHTDQKTITTEYGWIAVMCATILGRSVILLNTDI
jgi:hypothetical protein